MLLHIDDQSKKQGTLFAENSNQKKVVDEVAEGRLTRKPRMLPR